LPQQAVDQFSPSGGELDELVGVGQDLGTVILAGVPDAVRPLVEPLIPNIVASIHDAFSLAVAGTFVIGVVATVVAFVAAIAMRELPLRSTHGPAGEVDSDDEPPARVGEAPQIGETPALRGAPALD
jgi:hypothetical protein